MPPAGFEWDERKRFPDLEKHGIDFRDAIGLFDHPHLTVETIRSGDVREVGFGRVAHCVIAVVRTVCAGIVRIISARAARRMGDKPTQPVSELERRVGVSDFERIAVLSDGEIADAGDPDAAPLDIDWSQAEVTRPPRKVPVSIRLDADVLDFFRREGAGYQSRINAVLRSYVRARTDREG